MKKLVKLALFFSFVFIIIFLTAAGIRYLSLRVQWAQHLPQKPETFLTAIIPAAGWALSLAMYSSILLAFSYAARKRVFMLQTMFCVITLSLLLNTGISFALHQWKSITSAQIANIHLGESGLILSSSLNKNETAIILLNGMADPLGPRVTAVPGRALFYQEAAFTTGLNLPPVPFTNSIPWFIDGLFYDVKVNADLQQKRFAEGFAPYLIYTAAVVFLLSSINFIFKISVWPLANLFIGILAFRGILAVETFLNSREILELFESFFQNTVPIAMVVPSIFLTFSLLVNIYSILIFIAKRRGNDGY